MRTWETTASITQNFSVGLTGAYKLYLWMPDNESTLATRTDYSIQLANTGTWEASTGYNDLLQTISLNIVPIELTTFNARAVESAVELNWQTASEKNNNRFEIERSGDAKVWTSIGSVAGAGTSVQVKDYQFFDRNPLNGVQFFRLKQIDNNGEFSLSKVVTVLFVTKNAASFKIYPNPSTDKITIELPNSIKQTTLILSIFNTNGQLVYAKPLLPQTIQTIDLSDLSSGQYTLYSQVDGQAVSVHFVKR